MLFRSWTNENFENLNLVIEKLIENRYSEEYLKYEIDYFPSKNNEKLEMNINEVKFIDYEKLFNFNKYEK